jgi:hypothetical protein
VLYQSELPIQSTSSGQNQSAYGDTYDSHDVVDYEVAYEPSPEFFEDARNLLGPVANTDNDFRAHYPSGSVNGYPAHDHLADAGVVPMAVRQEVGMVAAPINTHIPIPVAAPLANAAAPQPSGQNLVCTTCGVATFGRVGEWRRHMKKHGPPSFFCTQAGCTMSFYRKDKLRDHRRQAHGI